MLLFRLLLSRYTRVAVFSIYSIVFLLLFFLLPSLSPLFFILYVVGIVVFVAFLNLFLSVGENVFSSFVNNVLTKMYDFPKLKDFSQIVKEVFGIVGLEHSSLFVFVDMGKGNYELLGGSKTNVKMLEIGKRDFTLSDFIETSKVRVPFVDLKNTTLLPQSVFEDTKGVMRSLGANLMVPIYSPNFEVLGLVFFSCTKPRLKKLFYLSQLLNIVGIMFKALNEAERKKAFEEDIRIASQIQEKLVPTKYTTNRWFESYGIYIPAYNIGGDYLDLIERRNNFFFAIGDVSGKGVSAGLVSIMVKAMLNSADVSLSSFLRVAKNINRNIYRWFYDEESILTFLTLFFACYTPSTRKLHYVNAGHVPCVLLRGSETILLHSTSRPLGLFESIDIRKESVEIGKGDVLMLYTDGLIEQIDERGREFGISRLKELLSSMKDEKPVDIVNSLVRRLKDFSQDRLNDDVCLLVVKFK